MKKKGRVAPLRKIVDRPMVSIGGDDENEYFMRQEQLECGHVQPVHEDLYGATNATRRRCKVCLVVNEAICAADL